MKQTDFDDYASQYKTILHQQHVFFEKNTDYFCEYKIKLVREFFLKPPESILDFGCGIGRSMPFFRKYFPEASLYGCDVSEKSLATAKHHFTFAEFFNKSEIMANKVSFDLIFLSGVLHHIPPNERMGVFTLLKSKLSPTGKIIVFEHNPFNPLTRKLVRECVFDQDAVLLKLRETKNLFKNNGAKCINGYYTLFFPGFLSWLRPLERFLKAVPLGGQYVVCGEF